MVRFLSTLVITLGLLAGPLLAEEGAHAPTTPASGAAVEAAPAHGDAPPAESATTHGESAGGHGGHGEAAPGDVGAVVKAGMQHHLTDSGHLELPLVSFNLDNLRIPLPFLDGVRSSTGNNTPLINWMVKDEDGHAYLMFSKHLIFLTLAFVIVLVVMLFARRSAGSASPRGIGNVVEALIVFLRDEVVLPNTGKEGRPYMPFFLTVFFFILTMNLLGLIPFGSSATGNLSVTAGLALCAFGMMQVAGMRAHGVLGHFKGLMPHGVPVFVAPILLPIEFLGMFTKPFALCVRLFANMMAGHAVIAAFIGLIVVPVLALTNLPVVVAIGMLELFVAFLQAYIFTMLTAIFSGSFIHQH